MGIKHLYELVPRGLTQRLKKERRKLWDEQQAAAVTAAFDDLSEANKAAGKAKGPEDKEKASKKEAECKNRTQLLKEMTEKYEDTGTCPWPQSVSTCPGPQSVTTSLQGQCPAYSRQCLTRETHYRHLIYSAAMSGAAVYQRMSTLFDLASWHH